MASRGTCTLLREISLALAGLPWSGGWQGDRERNSGLPGAESKLWAFTWDKAGEPGKGPWRRAAEEGEPCTGTRGGAAAGTPKLVPLAVVWLDKLKIPFNKCQYDLTMLFLESIGYLCQNILRLVLYETELQKPCYFENLKYRFQINSGRKNMNRSPLVIWKAHHGQILQVL